MLSSNLGLAIGCTGRLFLCFLQYFSSCRDNTSIGPRIFPSICLPIHPTILVYRHFFPMAQQPLMCQNLIIEASRSHSDTPQSVGHLWTGDQPDAETSTWQHTTITTDIHASSRIRTSNPSKRAAVDPRLRPRGHWDRQSIGIYPAQW